MKRKIESCKECKILNCEQSFDTCDMKEQMYIFMEEDPVLIKRFDLVDDEVVETIVGVIDVTTGTEPHNFITSERNKIENFEKYGGVVYPSWETQKIKKLV